jgi:toxin ParE1/3/4
MKRVEVDQRVVVEAIEAIEWYEARQEGLGRRFSADLDSLVEVLPSCRLRPLQGFKALGVSSVRFAKPWPYRLVVIERGPTLWVVALAHDKRAPGYWLPRLEEQT